jgi:hypothetical protein
MLRYLPSHIPARGRHSLFAPYGVLLILILAGCGGGDPPPAQLAPVPTAERLYYDDSGGIREASGGAVIRDDLQWEALWRQVTSLRDDRPALPAVDFERHMVVFYAAGQMPLESMVRVDSAGVYEQKTLEGDKRNVFKVVVTVGPGCPGIEASVYPVDIVRVPRFDGDVEFEMNQTENPDC